MSQPPWPPPGGPQQPQQPPGWDVPPPHGQWYPTDQRGPGWQQGPGQQGPGWQHGTPWQDDPAWQGGPEMQGPGSRGGPGRKSGRGPRVGTIVALVLAGASLFCTGVLSVFLVGATDDDASGGHTPQPQDAPPPPPLHDPTSSGPTSSTESSSPSSASSTSSSPSALPRAVPVLDDHPIMISGNGAPATSCELPAFTPDAEGQDALYNAALPCLMEAWEPMLEDANLPVQTPRVVTTEQDVRTPCGPRAWNETAMYCRGDHTIYMTARYYSEIEQRTEPGAFLGQFTHEFGHAVQGMIGINAAFGRAQHEAGGPESPAGLALTRRSELQASCFEGMSLAALQNGGLSNDHIFPALADSKDRGDEHTGGNDHGDLANNVTWIDRGFLDNDITRCNTWAAPPSAVE